MALIHRGFWLNCLQFHGNVNIGYCTYAPMGQSIAAGLNGHYYSVLPFLPESLAYFFRWFWQKNRNFKANWKPPS